MYLRIGGSAVDEGVLRPNPSVGGLFRCPPGLGADEEFAYATDGTAFTGSQEVQIIEVDRPGNQWGSCSIPSAPTSPVDSGEDGLRRRGALDRLTLPLFHESIGRLR